MIQTIILQVKETQKSIEKKICLKCKKQFYFYVPSTKRMNG